ncbi:MAG TPA: hypothetical protein VG735_14305 [Caulobacterales bacterium]|nr:hypothetical protein [Caulobacterales bacterium]
MDYLARMIAQLGFNEWLSLASALVAFISFMLSRAAVRRQEAMQFESLRADQDGRLISWADDAITAIADAQRHCRDQKNGLLTGDEAKRNCSELRTRMSALLDRGRLFFPNQPDSAGEEPEQAAEAAYVGQSQPAIDALYNAYRIISDLGRTLPLSPAEAVNAVVAQRRRFVSEVFRSVDPRRRQAALDALASQAGAQRR